MGIPGVNQKMKQIKFKSKKDGKKFNLKVPESSEEIENNEFIEIDGKTKFVEEVEDYDTSISDKVRNNGELVFSVDDVYDLYYFNSEFYDFYWDTASGCIFAKLNDEP